MASVSLSLYTRVYIRVDINKDFPLIVPCIFAPEETKFSRFNDPTVRAANICKQTIV